MRSNAPSVVQNTTAKAFKLFASQGSDGVRKAVAELSSLKGIGPATASLLLSVYEPAEVPFFGDEVFMWVVLGGKRGKIGYTAKEYSSFVEKVGEVTGRLGVTAEEVEKAGFAVVRGQGEAGESRQGRKRKEGAGEAVQVEKEEPTKKRSKVEQEEKLETKRKKTLSKPAVAASAPKKDKRREARLLSTGR